VVDPAAAALLRWRWETARKALQDGRDDTGRRWKVPKESPPGPDFDLRELEAIGRGEARRSPGLVPNGGRRWTREDLAFAVSILADEMRAPAFRKAWDAGMSKAQARLWLSKALRNRLLDHAECLRRTDLLDDLALDAFPAADDQRIRLIGDDVATLAAKLRRRLSEEAAWEVARRCGGDGIGTPASRARTGPSRATRARHWKEACAAIERLAREEGLNRTEAGVVMLALSAKMTGGGAAGGRFRESVRPLGFAGR
jgi:hypothetical protein